MIVHYISVQMKINFMTVTVKTICLVKVHIVSKQEKEWTIINSL